MYSKQPQSLSTHKAEASATYPLQGDLIKNGILCLLLHMPCNCYREYNNSDKWDSSKTSIMLARIVIDSLL